MTLLQDDVGWYLPERLDDTDDGGGEMTLTPLVEGPDTNLFDDVDDIARVYGEVSIRLAYAEVATANTDALFGPNFILTEVPEDPSATLLIGYPGAWGARRREIADRVSRFLARGPRYQGFLWELQVAGAMAITIFQNPANPAPNVGDALVIIENEGEPGEIEQYIRILKVSSVLKEFTILENGNSKTFTRMIVTLELSAKLDADFHGAVIAPYDNLTPAAILRTTIVADAVRFTGLKEIAPANADSLSVVVDTPYARIVPSSQGETPIDDLTGGVFSPQYIQSGDSRTQAANIAGQTLSLQQPVFPGSVGITGSATLTDTGTGLLTGAGVTATIDYSTGTIQLPYSGTWSMTGSRAGSVVTAADTFAIPVTTGNRGFVWVCLLPSDRPPTPGTVTVDYRALGRWYRLRDDGSRKLVSEGAGTGSIVSQTITATLTALPDIGSSVIFTWQTDLFHTDIAAAPIALPGYELDMGESIEPGTFEISWLSGGSTKTATDDGEGGFTGDISIQNSWINYTTGTLKLKPTATPDPVTNWTIAYDRRSSTTHGTCEAQTSNENRTVEGTISSDFLPAKPGTILIHVPLSYAGGTIRYEALTSVTDDGAGNLVSSEGWVAFGLVDYTNGDFSITLNEENLGQPCDDVWYTVNSPNTWGQRVTSPSHAKFVQVSSETSALTLFYAATKDSIIESVEKTTAIGPLTLELYPAGTGTLVPGSLLFSLGTSVYDDGTGSGLVYANRNYATGTGSVVGTVNYANRTVTITAVPATPITGATVLSGVVAFNTIPVFEVVSFIPMQLTPGMTQFVATTIDGRILTGQDTGGDIVGDEMAGTIDSQTGIYHVMFGKRVLDSGLTPEEKQEPWYHQEDVGLDGKIFRPTAVFPETVKLATRAITYLPLSADILGLDPVRLPLDGRIQIFHPGDVAVIHHTGSLGVTPSAGVTTNCGRIRLARVKVVANDGTLVPPAKYVEDLDAGTVTWANPLIITGYPTPWTVSHTIEDMAVITDVTIGGAISLNLRLSHNFPSGSKISGAVVATQDLWARTSIPFTQKTWTNVWSDSLIGDEPIWNYDLINHQIEVTNIGTRQERWVVIYESTTTFKVIGERSGQIASGISKNEDFAPVNPATVNIPGGPYPFFIIRAGGWGGGQSTGDCFRFNTYAANYPLALIRSIQPGPAYGSPSNFQLAIRGNVNQ